MSVLEEADGLGGLPATVSAILDMGRAVEPLDTHVDKTHPELPIGAVPGRLADRFLAELAASAVETLANTGAPPRPALSAQELRDLPRALFGYLLIWRSLVEAGNAEALANPSDAAAVTTGVVCAWREAGLGSADDVRWSLDALRLAIEPARPPRGGAGAAAVVLRPGPAALAGASAGGAAAVPAELLPGTVVRALRQMLDEAASLREWDYSSLGAACELLANAVIGPERLVPVWPTAVAKFLSCSLS